MNLFFEIFQYLSILFSPIFFAIQHSMQTHTNVTNTKKKKKYLHCGSWWAKFGLYLSWKPELKFGTIETHSSKCLCRLTVILARVSLKSNLLRKKTEIVGKSKFPSPQTFMRKKLNCYKETQLLCLTKFYTKCCTENLQRCFNKY